MTDPLGNPFTITYTNGSISEQKNYTLSINKTGNGSGNIKVNGQTKTLPYSGIFRGNSSDSVEAVFQTNSSFAGWSGDITSSENPILILMNGNKSLNAKFSLVQYSVTINKTGSGGVKVNDTLKVLPFTQLYEAGSKIKLEAVADPGNSFSGWSGDLNSVNNPDSIIIDANKTITAGFTPNVKFTLSLDKSGSGQIKVNDTIRTLPFSSAYNNGSQVKLEAVPDQGNVFSGWSGSFIGLTNPVIIVMNGNKTIIGNFKPIQYNLVITKSGNGSGQVKVNGVAQALPFVGAFNYGTIVNLEAVSDKGSNFSGWGGDLSGNANPAAITINGDKSVTATFEVIKYTLSIASLGNGSGQVKINGLLQALPYSALFDYNSNVTVESVPDTLSRFVAWSGDLSGTANPSVLTMSGNKSVSAEFQIIQYTLTVNKGGSGKIKINGALVTLPYTALYNIGTSLTVEAIPDSSSKFTSWSGDLTGNTNPAVIKMDKDKVITALFDVNIYSLTIDKGGNGTGQLKVNGGIKSLPYSGTFSFGVQVTLEAIAPSGSNFNGWSGDISGSQNPVTITINGSKKITATFQIIVYNLTINGSGSGSGQIKVNGNLRNLPFAGSFNSGANLTLEAIASSGSNFSSWSGDLSGSSNPVAVTMDGNKTITSIFTINAPNVPLLSYPGNNYKYMPVDLLLKWSKISNALSYHFQLSADSSFSKVLINDTTLVNPQISVRKLQNKTKYFWRIRAKNLGGYSNFSQAWSFLTQIEAIVCPTFLKVSLNGSQINLDWNDNSTNETGFQIFRKNGDSSSTKPYVNIGSVGQNVNSFSDLNMSTGDIYTYLVYAYNEDTISCFTNQASIQTVTAVLENQIPKKFEMYQNYPNPFNPATNISFDLPSEANVSLKIYDILGREVAIIINNEYKSAGKYTVSFNGSSLTSGEYIYVIRAGEYRAVKKFIILK
jgi:hypothetical protein